MAEFAYDRLELLVQKDGINKLKNTKCIIFGLGGVGSYVTESLARSFIGELTLVDFDKISITNINRQLHANFKSIGKWKTQEMKNRILSINPECNVKIYETRLNDSNMEEFDLASYDFVIDAIDDITSKIALIKYCLKNKIRIISSMGAANKLNPEMLKIGKIKNTTVCPLARKIRHELLKEGYTDLTVVYSTEHIKNKKGNALGSTSFVPSVAGLYITSYVVRTILEI
ncbi:tRNA threonylcarbamoyladenosine dehydratase [Caviibacter abscessus]|uniref:tRNA threonylcarbamoyladenosine dehydratase n=1 Tax=Caviibacter abscessus TaxID=1766719 RepID=UPI000833CF71|nr:tRNA threonylcarbamoyladenosine dehydratase [Caviibacter abscessus]